MVAQAASDFRFDAVLKSVSRSFYLTLAVLPSGVRRQMGLAYLLARAADSLADTDLIGRPQRVRHLTRFAEWIQNPPQHAGMPDEIRAALGAGSSDPAERMLLAHLEDCVHLLESFSPDDQARIRRVLKDLISGMQNDLTTFPGSTARELVSLTTVDDLDRYTYYAAGCVGDFWTRMMCAHRAALDGWELERMAAVGVRFGKGLQYTNVLRDIPADLRRGRCYIPVNSLSPVGLKPADLLDPSALPKFRPVLSGLVRIALDHLDQGWLYTMAIPRREVRLRLACAWPILIAVKTLQRVSVSPDLLSPDVTLKITRGEIYRIMALTAGTLGCARTLTAYYGHLRKQVAC